MAIQRSFAAYKKLKRKLQKSIQDLYFLLQCRDQKIIPAFLKISCKPLNDKDHRVLRIAQERRLKVMIRCKRKSIDYFNKLCYKEYGRIAQRYSENWVVFDLQMCMIQIHLDKDFNKIQDRHGRKLNNLCNKRNSHGNNYNYWDKYEQYINKSSMVLENKHIEILNRGMKFAHPVVLHRSEKFVPQYENILNRVKFDKDSIRHKLVKSIEKQITHQDNNITIKYDRAALLEIRNNENIIVTTADKTKQIIILNKCDYYEKVQQAIQDMNVVLRNRDPVNRIKIELAKFKNYSRLPESIRKKCIPPIGAMVPSLYGTVKVHKDGDPIRPIVSKNLAPTYLLEGALQEYLSQYIKNSRYSMNNSIDVIRALKTFDGFNKPFMMFTMDVQAMYPNVPVQKAIQIIEQKLLQEGVHTETVHDIVGALVFISRNNYFRFEGQVYHQIDGAPMGSPMSGILAEVIMRDIEEELMNRKDILLPNLYLRYIDDILIFWNHPVDEIEGFMQLYTNKYPTIKLQAEMEKDTCIGFLDIHIQREKRKLQLKVYRKPTYIPSVIPNSSSHPKHYKLAAFRSFIHRAFTHCSSEILFKQEIDYIHEVAMDYGYDKKIIDQLIQQISNKLFRRNNRECSTMQKPTYIGSVPYIPEVNRCLKNLIKGQGLAFGQKTSTLKEQLVSAKESVEDSYKAGVYQIPVVDGQSGKVVSKYIGSTRRNIDIRRKEHVRNWKNKEDKTALISYCMNNKAYPDFQRTKHLISQKTEKEILMAESIIIFKNKNNVCNDNLPCDVPHDWHYVIKKEVHEEEGGLAAGSGLCRHGSESTDKKIRVGAARMA